MTIAVQRFPVYLRVYDISDGAASVWSPLLLWKKIDGIWHTGIHAYGFEYFYGGGILKMLPRDVEESYNLKPREVLHLGYTTVPQSDFERFLDEISNEFSRATYDILKWNCNNFTDTAAKFLVERGIPEKIVKLPEIVNKTLMGKVILKMMKNMRGTPPVGAEDHVNRSERVAATTTRQRRLSAVCDVPEMKSVKADSKANYGGRNNRRHSCPNANNAEIRRINDEQYRYHCRAAMKPVQVNRNAIPQRCG